MAADIFITFRQWLARIRKNHALEHATINVLSQRYPGAQLVGLSSHFGFTIYSSLTAEEIVPAARQALRSLKGGATELAVHENCGTNLVITAVLTTLATLVGLGGSGLRVDRSRRTLFGVLERMPQAVLLNSIALMVAPPLARWVQTHVTTNPNLIESDITSFFTDYQGGLRRVRVYTRHGPGTKTPRHVVHVSEA